MKTEDNKTEKQNNSLNVLAGVAIGGLAGAAAMLLMAPQSGKATRTQIQLKSIELRDKTSNIIEDVITQVSSDKDKLVMNGQQKAKEILHQGQALMVEQLEHVSETAQAGKKAIQSK